MLEFSAMLERVMKTKNEISPLMHELASYISRAGKKPLPKPVVEKTKHHVLDTIAAMVSGSKLLPGEKAISYIKTQGGTPEATVIGSRFVTTAMNAALANGMLGHADETDDSHAPSLTHPGCGIVPAALEMMDQRMTVLIENWLHAGFPIDAAAILIGPRRCVDSGPKTS